MMFSKGVKFVGNNFIEAKKYSTWNIKTCLTNAFLQMLNGGYCLMFNVNFKWGLILKKVIIV